MTFSKKFLSIAALPIISIGLGGCGAAKTTAATSSTKPLTTNPSDILTVISSVMAQTAASMASSLTLPATGGGNSMSNNSDTASTSLPKVCTAAGYPFAADGNYYGGASAGGPLRYIICQIGVTDNGGVQALTNLVNTQQLMCIAEKLATSPKAAYSSTVASTTFTFPVSGTQATIAKACLPTATIAEYAANSLVLTLGSVGSAVTGDANWDSQLVLTGSYTWQSYPFPFAQTVKVKASDTYIAVSSSQSLNSGQSDQGWTAQLTLGSTQGTGTLRYVNMQQQINYTMQSIHQNLLITGATTVKSIASGATAAAVAFVPNGISAVWSTLSANGTNYTTVDGTTNGYDLITLVGDGSSTAANYQQHAYKTFAAQGLTAPTLATFKTNLNEKTATADIAQNTANTTATGIKFSASDSSLAFMLIPTGLASSDSLKDDGVTPLSASAWATGVDLLTFTSLTTAIIQ